MLTELTTFHTSDGVALDGAWYRPENGGRAGVGVLLVHGKARNFYTGPSRFLAPHIVARGFAALAINRRGHDVIYSKPGPREPAGAAYEVFADSQQDILGAADWLARQRYPRLALVGHSFGGVASTCFAAQHPARVAALVLCSAAAGGPDYLERVSKDWLGGDALSVLLERARGMRAAGRGEDLLLAPKWWWAISARSALELDVPDLVESAARTTCPILAIRGSLEPVDAYPIERVRDAVGGRATTRIVGGDHYYAGYEEAVGDLVADWLAKTL
jgi:pimeloyl-ACP methyl ester carboxylesterase